MGTFFGRTHRRFKATKPYPAPVAIITGIATAIHATPTITFHTKGWVYEEKYDRVAEWLGLQGRHIPCVLGELKLERVVRSTDGSGWALQVNLQEFAKQLYIRDVVRPTIGVKHCPI